MYYDLSVSLDPVFNEVLINGKIYLVVELWASNSVNIIVAL